MESSLNLFELAKLVITLSAQDNRRGQYNQNNRDPNHNGSLLSPSCVSSWEEMLSFFPNGGKPRRASSFRVRNGAGSDAGTVCPQNAAL